MWIPRHGIIQSAKNQYIPPLDVYTNAAAAYSTRRLRSAYTGFAIRVRRTSDNTEQDIGFDGSGNLNENALLSFTGSSSGQIRTWYDQSGNGRNLTQTTQANQPTIVGSGSIVRHNALPGGRPAINFVTAGLRLVSSFTAITQPITTFSCVRLVAGTGLNASVIYDSYNNTSSVLFYSGITEPTNNRWKISSGTSGTSTVSEDSSVRLMTALHNGASSFVNRNGTQIISANIGTNSLDGLSVGNVRGNPSPILSDYTLQGRIPELIIYGSDQSSNITLIEANINSYYSIY